MLDWARWVSLVLAISSLVAWAWVSSLHLTYQGPTLFEMTAPGKPRRYSDQEICAYHNVRSPVNLTTLRRLDVGLRLAMALLVGAHLVILNLGRARL